MARQERFAFGHLTDPHLPLLGADLAPFTVLLGKRASGAISWQTKRRKIHRPEVLDALVADIHAHAPQHIVLTGDLVNLSLPPEFERAALWLARLGAPQDVSLVPGNHDAYVRVPWDRGLGLWHAYLTGDGDGTGPRMSRDAPFPYVRRRGPLVFIGVSTAVPLPLFFAAGRVGSVQRERLRILLTDLGRERLARIVLLHHPPGRAGASPRRGLLDREGLLAVLAEAGADLVLHGHTHRSVLESVPGPSAPIPVLAPASASARSGEPATWHFITAEASARGFSFTVKVRGIDPETLHARTLGQFVLPAGPANSASASSNDSSQARP